MTGTPIIRTTDAGTSAAPTYTFHGDTRTGLYRAGANHIGLAVGGVQKLGIATFFTSQPIYDNQAGTANVSIASNGRLTRITSALKYKQDVETADLTDVELRPVQYTSKEHGTRHLGLVADEVAKQIPTAGVYDDGEIEDYDTRAVIAVLVAKVNALTDRLAALED